MELVPYKRGSREIPSPFHYVRTQQEVGSLQPRKESLPDHAGTLISDFQPLEL